MINYFFDHHLFVTLCGGSMPYLEKPEGMKRQYVWTEQDLINIENFAQLGFSHKDIAKALGVPTSTFQLAMKKDEEEAATFIGDEVCRSQYLDQNMWFRYSRGVTAHKMIISRGIMNLAKDGNATVLIHLSKTRLGWKDNTEQVLESLQIGGSDSQKIKDEVERRIALELKLRDKPEAIELLETTTTHEGED